MKKLIILIFIALLIQPLKAQGEAAVPFLALQQSPLLFGAGLVGTAISSNHPFGFYYNPAQLGNSSRENNISIFFMPEESKWLERIVPDLKFQTDGVSVGYNFKTEEGGLPLSIGLGYLANEIGYGKFVVTGPDSPKPIGEYYPYDQFKSISIGASYDYLLRFNLGFSIKMYKSNLPSHFVDNRIEKSIATGTAFDLGLMVTTPITKLVFNDYKINLNTNSSLKPKFDFTLGYSLSNLGEKVVYRDQTQADPLPRMARLGYSFNFSLEFSNTKVEKFSFIDYSFTAESDDILIIKDTTGKSEYQNPFGGIKPVKHLIELKGDDDVVVHKGHILRLFETLTLVSGRFNGRGYDHRKTSGIGISSEGLFKLLNSAFDVPGLNYFTKHFVCEYYETIIFKESELETRMNGIVLSYKGFFF